MNRVKNMMQEAQYVMIFGARPEVGLKHKNFGLQIEDEILSYGKNITCYVVSSKANNPDKIGIIPVLEISEIPEVYKKDGVIVISNALSKQDEIGKMLMTYGFRHIIHAIRMYSSLNIEEEDYYKQYNWNISMKHMPEIYEEKATAQNLFIYVVTSHTNAHKETKPLESKVAQYIQAGSALTDMKICEISDSTGINISTQNPFYCELSAGYWIYKNDCIHDYVGLYHYSRMFDLTDDKIFEILNSGVDVILAEPVIYFTRRGHYWCDDILLKQVFYKIVPQYVECFQNYTEEGLLIPSNMVICSKKIYDDYYQWMMSILEAYEQELNANNVEMKPRVMGYIAEELTGIYFLHHSTDLRLLFVKQKQLY